MITPNNGRRLMTPQSLAGNASESLPSFPHTGDEVIAINPGATFTYTLLGTIDGLSNLVLTAGTSAVLVYTSGSGWRTVGSSGGGGVVFPITVAEGGTGADLSASPAGSIPFFGTGVFDASGNFTFAKTADGDSATSVLSLSATDSNAHTSTIRFGIELPGDGASAGDAVLRTGAGVLRQLVRGTDGATFFGSALPGTDFPLPGILNVHVGAPFYLGINITDAPNANQNSALTVIANPNNSTQPALFAQSAAIFDGGYANAALAAVSIGLATGTTALQLINTDTTGNSDLIGIHFKSSESPTISATGDFQFQNSGLGNGTSFFDFNFGGGPLLHKFWSDGGTSFGRDGDGFSVAGLAVSHATLPSLLVQNSAGANASATVDVLGITAQTSNLQNWRGTDGSTIVAHVGIAGDVDATAYSVAGAPGVSGSITALTTATVVNGLITAIV